MSVEMASRLEPVIGVTFHEPRLLGQALIHSSYANERNLGKSACNERLEFLGDAVLELVMSDYLYQNYQKDAEGRLTRLRASLVCETTLALCAREISLGDYLFLSKGEIHTGGRNRDSILSDAFEAVIGAIYLDRGFEEAGRFIRKHLLENVDEKVLFYDAKTKLQEIIQGESRQNLSYVLVNEDGPDHMKTFTVEARLGDEVLGRGMGRSKKNAEQMAAFEAIKKQKK